MNVSGRAVTIMRGGGGEPVVYLHGLCDVHSALSCEQWPEFLVGLTRGFEVIAPALPGYNGSTGLDEFQDVEDYVWHLVDLFDALGLERPHLVGHSIGGWFAAELALRRPDRVRDLVLVDPLGVHVDGLEIPSFFAAAAPRGVGGFGEVRRLLFADSESSAALEALPDVLAHEQQLLWFGGLAGAARLGWKAPHFQSRKLTRRLGRLSARTLVLRGEYDALVPEVAALAWTGALPKSEMVQVARAGHCVPLERPEAAARVVRFLAEQEGGRE